MKAYLLASVAAAFASNPQNFGETEEVVMVGGVRVSRSAYEADQASDKPVYGKLDSAAKQADVEQAVVGTTLDTSGPPLAAPSAPNFGDGQAPPADILDPLKNAVAPEAHGENARLVIKSGTGAKPYKVVDGSGNPIEMDGIDPKGYATEDGAWQAIRALPH